ncbi:MAG: acetylglutamate kinase [Alphaproteobacteria bacterium]|nr:acetylglutamate kinase [Alphaproteobacteria bacterium]
MTRSSQTEFVAEVMDELEAYRNRTVVMKIGGNAIAEDDQFLAKIGKQVRFLTSNGVRVVVVHGGGPQIDEALRLANIPTAKGKDGRRITTPKAVRVVHKAMNALNLQIADALVKAGCEKARVVPAAKIKSLLVKAKPSDPVDGGKQNRVGVPQPTTMPELGKLIAQDKIIVLHCVCIGTDGKTVFNTNADDYAMAVAIGVKAKRLLLVTNVAGVLDKQGQCIPVMDADIAKDLIQTGVISGGMIPKVESALSTVEHGVGGVVILDGFVPWSILAEMLTHQGQGTLFRMRVV